MKYAILATAATCVLRTDLQAGGSTPLWNAINVGITALLHQDGRRVILVFSDGADAPLTQASTNSSLKDVMKRADDENVMVYAIGLAGSNPPPAARMVASSVADADARAVVRAAGHPADRRVPGRGVGGEVEGISFVPLGRPVARLLPQDTALVLLMVPRAFFGLRPPPRVATIV